jgi:hypothetical protein
MGFAWLEVHKLICPPETSSKVFRPNILGARVIRPSCIALVKDLPVQPMKCKDRALLGSSHNTKQFLS